MTGLRIASIFAALALALLRAGSAPAGECEDDCGKVSKYYNTDEKCHILWGCNPARVKAADPYMKLAYCPCGGCAGTEVTSCDATQYTELYRGYVYTWPGSGSDVLNCLANAGVTTELPNATAVERCGAYCWKEGSTPMLTAGSAAPVRTMMCSVCARKSGEVYP
ncbi:MAG TPA: hypothetical protein VKA21_12585 [Candidatus Binatia bacterium]|nr:hypothetical protein [Candidatus Binatia bacterium]